MVDYNVMDACIKSVMGHDDGEDDDYLLCYAVAFLLARDEMMRNKVNFRVERAVEREREREGGGLVICRHLARRKRARRANSMHSVRGRPLDLGLPLTSFRVSVWKTHRSFEDPHDGEKKKVRRIQLNSVQPKMIFDSYSSNICDPLEP